MWKRYQTMNKEIFSTCRVAGQWTAYEAISFAFALVSFMWRQHFENAACACTDILCMFTIMTRDLGKTYLDELHRLIDARQLSSRSLSETSHDMSISSVP
jgi:hypothetical protein